MYDEEEEEDDEGTFCSFGSMLGHCRMRGEDEAEMRGRMTGMLLAAVL